MTGTLRVGFGEVLVLVSRERAVGAGPDEPVRVRVRQQAHDGRDGERGQPREDDPAGQAAVRSA